MQATHIKEALAGFVEKVLHLALHNHHRLFEVVVDGCKNTTLCEFLHIAAQETFLVFMGVLIVGSKSSSHTSCQFLTPCEKLTFL